MHTIFINEYPHHSQDTFVVIVPSSKLHAVGEFYIIQDYFSKNLVTKSILVDIETYELGSLPDGLSYLANNCDAELTREILRDRYKTFAIVNGYTDGFITEQTKVDVLFFTKKHNVKKLMEYEMKRYAPKFVDVKKSLTSNKNMLSKNYIHKSQLNNKS